MEDQHLSTIACVLALLALAACNTNPPAPVTPRASAPARPSATPQAPASRGPEAASPTPLPSLGLLYSGQIRVEPQRMLAAGLARRTATGVQLIGPYGAGIVADHGGALTGKVKQPDGVDLLSEGGLGLLSEGGLGLIGATSGNLIADVGSSLIGRKAPAQGGYRLLQADATDLTPIQDIMVFAVGLRDGKVLAGPVATNADGSYRLGFLQAPDQGVRIMAQVYGKAADPTYNYAALAAPVSGRAELSDSTRAVSLFLLDIMRRKVQDGLDIRKRGEVFHYKFKGARDATTQAFLDQTAAVINLLPQDAAQRVDHDGATALAFAGKVLSYADLAKPVYADLLAATEELRELGRGASPAFDPPLVEQVVALSQDEDPGSEVHALMLAHGVDAARADAAATHYFHAGDAVFVDLAATAKAHLEEVFEPFTALASPAP